MYFFISERARREGAGVSMYDEVLYDSFLPFLRKNKSRAASREARKILFGNKTFFSTRQSKRVDKRLLGFHTALLWC